MLEKIIKQDDFARLIPMSVIESEEQVLEVLENSINFESGEKKLINTHIYEVAIYPEINNFKIGEQVKIRDCFNNFKEGYIENFNADGTIFIKINLVFLFWCTLN